MNDCANFLSYYIRNWKKELSRFRLQRVLLPRFELCLLFFIYRYCDTCSYFYMAFWLVVVLIIVYLFKSFPRFANYVFCFYLKTCRAFGIGSTVKMTSATSLCGFSFPTLIICSMTSMSLTSHLF